ncbi:hypothetical protein ACIBBG_31920 [Micromonospora chersina]|uniref:hypothetical protein n=1 Tax=Micromonospora chersina TaxID=47854 RepID=UPI0037A21D65
MSQDDRLDPDFMVALARTTEDNHAEGKTCRECADDGCKQLDWARDILAQARTDRAAFRQRVATW